MSVPDGHDLQGCKQHIAGKPPPAGMDFLQLVDIIMIKEDWNYASCEEALDISCFGK